jgi:hypothetical protein
MNFSLHGGKVWLLKQLTEYHAGNREVVATATVRDVRLAGPGK